MACHFHPEALTCLLCCMPLRERVSASAGSVPELDRGPGPALGGHRLAWPWSTPERRDHAGVRRQQPGEGGVSAHRPRETTI